VKYTQIDLDMSSENTNIFGQQLSKKIPKKERAEFARKVGVSYEAVRLWCEGKSLPNGAQLIKIREVLGVSIDWLLTGKRFSSQNPGIILMDNAERYPLIKSMVPRINRGMREGLSEEAMAETIVKLAEIELIRLRDALKTKENKEEDENEDE